MTAQAHRPVAGTPIVSVSNRETLGYWTEGAPSFYPDQLYRFAPRLPVSVAYQAIAAEKLEPIQTYDIWRTWGDPARGHQVWLTTATDPRELDGLKGVRPVYREDTDYAKDAAAIRRVLAMGRFPHSEFDRSHMADYATYLEARAAKEAA